ncbi:MAG: phenylalanine--tRNA ligase subunit alpha [Candidatus Peribacteraceae bacterium]|nr:phenylalanine--tRNA ligase subunit alpha [Candidatus Peribacteraceae bacterium]
MPLSSPWDGFLAKIAACASVADLDAIEHELFGRKAGALTTALKQLGGLAEAERKTRGQECNAARVVLTEAVALKREALKCKGMDSLAKDDTLDVTLDLPEKERGHAHLIHEYIRKAEEVFGRMGFDVAEGPELETEKFQFDLLNFPKHHAARDSQDIFYIHGTKDPEDRELLRGHTSTVQIRYMRQAGRKPPFRMICSGKVFRKDADATHSPMFHQIEGLMISKDVTLANMKAVMETAVKNLVDPNVDFRWRTGYFPFVEPGLEMDLRWRGDESKSREGRWLEVVGCGMVHPNVLKNVGIDPKKFQGFAFGFGVERMLMIRHQIPDIRLFFNGDLRFLKQF